MNAYFAGTGSILFAMMCYHYYRKSREDQLKELYNSYPNKAVIFKEVHDRIAEFWDSEMDSYEWSKRIDKYRKVLCSYAEGKVLEVGIGTGMNFPYYPRGISLFGIDWSENMLEQSRKKAEKNVKLAVMDARDLQLADNSCDTVVGTFVLSSSDMPEKVIEEMFRVCKENGKVLILDRGKTGDILTMVLLSMFRFKYLFKYGYDQCTDIERIIRDSPGTVLVKEKKQGGHIYFYILTKSAKGEISKGE